MTEKKKQSSSAPVRKQKVFVYERREIFLLSGLVLLVSLFAFTLGVHLGKNVHQSGAPEVDPLPEVVEVEPREDSVPGRYELSEQIYEAQSELEKLLSQNLHDEVGRTGIEMSEGRQVDLPDQREGGREEASTLLPDKSREEALERERPDGSVTLQVASYETQEEALDKAESLEALDLEPFVRDADLGDKGIWYRVYLEGFQSKEKARAYGEQLQAEHLIDSYMVAPMPKT